MTLVQSTEQSLCVWAVEDLNIVFAQFQENKKNYHILALAHQTCWVTAAGHGSGRWHVFMQRQESQGIKRRQEGTTKKTYLLMLKSPREHWQIPNRQTFFGDWRFRTLTSKKKYLMVICRLEKTVKFVSWHVCLCGCVKASLPVCLRFGQALWAWYTSLLVQHQTNGMGAEAGHPTTNTIIIECDLLPRWWNTMSAVQHVLLMILKSY